MSSIIVNYATLLAFAAFTGDILLQIRQVWRRKSSYDVSITGIVVRVVGGLIILTKFILLDDAYLILGQALFSATISSYLLLLVYYRVTPAGG